MAPNPSVRHPSSRDDWRADSAIAAQAGVYEIHLTTSPIATQALATFGEQAKQLGTKPLLIELSRGLHPLQPMLTFEHAGELGSAMARAQDVAAGAEAMGHTVCRCKIECRADADVAGPYLEWHGRIAVAPDAWPALAALCREHGAHLSNNALKHSASRYVTLRGHAGLAALQDHVAALCHKLETQDWRFDKQQWERVVFDSNLPLDAGWLET